MMNFELKDFIQVVVFLGGLLAAWIRGQYKIERLEEKNSEILRHIETIWKKKDEQDSFVINCREDCHKNISELRGGLMVTSEQVKQIMSTLNEIKEIFSDLRSKLNV